MKDFGLKRGPPKGESMAKIITKEIIDGLESMNTSSKEKIFFLLSGLFESVNCEHLTIFSVAGEKNGTGFIKMLSVPELELENHLVFYSSVYGTMFISRESVKNDIDRISGDYFCAFDEVPAVIGVGTCSGKSMQLIHKMKEKNTDKYISEISAAMAKLIFRQWENAQACRAPNLNVVFQFVGNEIIEA